MDTIVIINSNPGPVRPVDPSNRQAVLELRAPGRKSSAEFRGQTTRLSISERDLDIINERHTSEQLGAGDVVVFERYSVNDSIMRSPIRFTKRALEKFALDFEAGRGVHIDHDSGRGFGRTFAADVVSATVRGIDANWLRLKFYAVTKDATEERLQVIKDVQSGILGFDSITFMGGLWKFEELKSEGGETLYFHEIDDDANGHPRLEAMELSVLSVLGRVYGAGDAKGKSLSLSAGGLDVAENDLYAELDPDNPAPPRPLQPSPDPVPLSATDADALLLELDPDTAGSDGAGDTYAELDPDA